MERDELVGKRSNQASLTAINWWLRTIGEIAQIKRDLSPKESNNNYVIMILFLAAFTFWLTNLFQAGTGNPAVFN